MIEMNDVSVARGGRIVLRRIDLIVNAGEAVALIGENGSGKTTLLRTLTGELRLRSGSVRVAGYDTKEHMNDVRLRLGVVPHSNGLYPLLTAEEHLLLFGRLYGMWGERLHARVRSLLEFTDLLARCREFASTLSAGMARRLSVACALVHNPVAILLDEPMDNMDQISRERMCKMIDYLKSAGAAIVIATHDPDDLRRVVDRVVLLSGGTASDASHRVRSAGVASCGA